MPPSFSLGFLLKTQKVSRMSLLRGRATRVALPYSEWIKAKSFVGVVGAIAIFLILTLIFE